MSTSMWASEVDLEHNRVRSFADVARRPAPLIVPPSGPLNGMLHLQPWRSLSDEEQQRLRAALDAWLATCPPPDGTYRSSYGREAGYTLRFRLLTDDATFSVCINPDVPPPGLEWCLPDRSFWELVGALRPNQASWP
jgi:hypothetical protein